jgi:2-polyprenyl-3-methyl-5-hydroxy-6-metoxy-1,4-benzoquinol methylase
MIYTDFYKTIGHEFEEYESSHKNRLDFLVEDLKLSNLYNQKIADVGCGLGFIFCRLPLEIQKNYYGFDGADIKDPFSTDYDDFFDTVLCFETIEHLTNPYNCLLHIKKMLKTNGTLYLSVPHQATEHNTIYPSLIYPADNFVQFLRQMAFEVIDHRVHSKNFHQNVFRLRNKNWDQSEMLWRKNEEKFRNIPPHISINL